MNQESIERETLEVDVLFVGAGPASLASAIHLKQLLMGQNKNDETLIAVIEKSKEIGQHILSGAVMDPKSIQELLGDDWLDQGFPIEAPVQKDDVYYLTQSGALKFPIHPPLMKNKGFYVISLSRVVEWLAKKAESLGIEVLPGFPASEILWNHDQVIGVRTIDQMVDHENQPKDNFMPGADIFAKITVFGEGTRGSLTKTLIQQTKTEGMNPMIYGTGIKEIWEIDEGKIQPGEVFHTAGWPLNASQYGGSWVYGLTNNRVSIGFVSALDNQDPHFDPYAVMQMWKTHPKIKALLSGGTLIKSGAKTIPEGGLNSMPRLYGPGYFIIGDSGSFLNAPRLKGVHTAMKSGMLAAEVIQELLPLKEITKDHWALYDKKFKASWLYQELYAVRNFRQAFKNGFWFGMFRAGLQTILKGRDYEKNILIEADHTHMKADCSQKNSIEISYDGTLTFNKDTAVYHAGSVHEENQPSHLKVSDLSICHHQCRQEYQNPCEHFCPASVYEIGSEGLMIHHTNCVHCKTCDILDPYQIIQWTVPVDAGGPNYMGM